MNIHIGFITSLAKTRAFNAILGQEILVLARNSLKIVDLLTADTNMIKSRRKILSS